MLERDYIMRLISELIAAMRRSIEKSEGERDPESAAYLLEQAVGQATDLDSSVLLSLSPDSIASILQVSGTDPRVIEFIVRGLLLASSYHAEAGNPLEAEVRAAQAQALAEAYDLPGNWSDVTPEALEGFFEENS